MNGFKSRFNFKHYVWRRSMMLKQRAFSVCIFKRRPEAGATASTGRRAQEDTVHQSGPDYHADRSGRQYQMRSMTNAIQDPQHPLAVHRSPRRRRATQRCGRCVLDMRGYQKTSGII